MKQWTAVLGVTGLVLALAGPARAQSREIPGESVTESGTVEAIDYGKRVLNLREADGKLTTVDIPTATQRIEEIKVGDTIKVTYYDNVVVRKKAAGEKAVNDLQAAVTPSEGQKPGATVASQRTMTAKVEAIDPKVPSITFTGPNGWKYSRRIVDKSVLKQVNVGDLVDFTWTDALTITVVAPKK